MNTKETVNDDKKSNDKKVDDWIDTVGIFESLPEGVQNAILDLMRTILHNG